ncbi:MAG TPA: hypothetical protein VIG64_03565 [Actinomycetota bacterium]
MNGIARSVALGARCAGGVIALGYLLGVVPGPIVPVIGGLALMTFGHGLLLDRSSRLFAGLGLAILAGAVGIAALRWGVMGLEAIRGAQQVLGPTVMVGPTRAATASWIAAIAGVLGLAVWVASSRPKGRAALAGWAAEVAIGALVLVWVFWGDAHDSSSGSGSSPAALLEWALAIAVAGAVAVAIAIGVGRLGTRWRWAVPGIAGAGVVAAAGLVASVL